MMLFQKTTLFLVLCPLLFVVALGYAIYYYRSDSTGLGTSYMILFLLAITVVFALDRVAVRFAPAGWVSAIEAGLVLAGFLLNVYTGQTTTLDLSGNPSPYVVLIWVKNPARAEPLTRTSLTNRTLTRPTGQVVLMDYAEFPKLNVVPPGSWNNGFFSTGIDLTDARFVSAYIYAPENHGYSKEQIQQLIRQAVAQQNQ